MSDETIITLTKILFLAFVSVLVYRTYKDTR